MANVKRKLLHNRNISLKGYVRNDKLFEIEAELLDTKNYNFKNQERGIIKKDEPIHHMKIKLVLDDNLHVVDAEAETKKSPYSICKNANSNFKKIIGLQIKSGWKREITKLIGGTNGCTHITELLSSAATAAFQTIYPYKSKQKKENETTRNQNQDKPLLLGTCHAFNSKSEVVKRLWPKWHEN
ncbi:DUF2889 domain-containing protein [Alphaproteobacteria bacterium]|nr:DUF2889 domain-containing protein [Alphaproteobacteria bacterium]